MILEKINLYDYFGVNRPDGATDGNLIVYMHTPNDRESPDRKRPAMLVVGGGGYEYVSPREKEPIAMLFYANGYNAFVLEYSCPCKYPTDLVEACMAMAYIRENAAKYQVDAEHVAAIGFSAGGHLCGSLSFLYKEEAVKAALGEKYKLCKPDATVFCYPVITGGETGHQSSIDVLSAGDEAIVQQVTLNAHVTADAPPAFIWTTVNDDCVDSRSSLLLACAYKEVGVPFELHMFENGVHGLSVCTVETGKTNEQVAQWKALALNWLTSRGFVIYE